MSANHNSDLLRAQLADQYNVVQCPDCTKPILESAMAQHAVNCQKIRERAQQQLSDGGRKRRLSDATADDPIHQKKAKPLSLVLTLGDAAKQQQQLQPSPAGTQAPKIVLKDQKDKPHRPRGPIDLDKHCGVINDKGLPCSRSLTCKTHAMGAKRSVPHRSRPYDDLLADWQRAKMAASANGSSNGNMSGGAGGRQQGRGGDSEIDADGDSPAGQPLSASVTPAAAPFAMLPPAPLAGPSGAVVKEKKRKRKNHQGEYGAGPVAGGLAGSSNALFGTGKERRTRAGGEGGKKGLLVVGEWEDVADAGSTGAADDDLLIDSDEEVEAVLKGLARVQPASLGNAPPVGVIGRPLSMFAGGGAGYAAASFFMGRNYRLARLRDTLGGVFATRG